MREGQKGKERLDHMGFIACCKDSELSLDILKESLWLLREESVGGWAMVKEGKTVRKPLW